MQFDPVDDDTTKKKWIRFSGVQSRHAKKEQKQDFGLYEYCLIQSLFFMTLIWFDRNEKFAPDVKGNTCRRNKLTNRTIY